MKRLILTSIFLIICVYLMIYFVINHELFFAILNMVMLLVACLIMYLTIYNIGLADDIYQIIMKKYDTWLSLHMHFFAETIEYSCENDWKIDLEQAYYMQEIEDEIENNMCLLRNLKPYLGRKKKNKLDEIRSEIFRLGKY